MIFLLGASGYVGKAFQDELVRRGSPHRTISRSELDYSRFRVILDALKTHRPKLVINCGGFTGKPNVDACETQRSRTIDGNVVLQQTVAEACDAAGVRLGAISSGCIFSGAKVRDAEGIWSVREDLNAPDLAELLGARSPRIRGFDENDEPNFTFETGGSFYSGTKAVGEKILLTFPSVQVWRLRIPFNGLDGPRNYLSKIQNYSKVYQNWNSLSHLGDFVSACLDLAATEKPGGAYNVVNPGYVSTREVVELVQKELRPEWKPEFWLNDKEFYQQAASARRSNCLLDTTKLIESGIKMRDVHTAVLDCLRTWKKAGAA
jgi:dTDP-4-dehydrorhamnose reductase